MNVRPLNESDRAEWLRMRLELWPECPSERHALEIRMLADAGSGCAVFVVDRGGGRLGGFIEVSVRHGVDGARSEDVGSIDGSYVDEDLRGRAPGRRLIAAAERWTLDRGLREIASDAELHNEQGIAAHKALGFRQTFQLVHFLKDLDQG